MASPPQDLLRSLGGVPFDVPQPGGPPGIGRVVGHEGTAQIADQVPSLRWTGRLKRAVWSGLFLKRPPPIPSRCLSALFRFLLFADVVAKIVQPFQLPLPKMDLVQCVPPLLIQHPQALRLGALPLQL